MLTQDSNICAFNTIFILAAEKAGVRLCLLSLHLFPVASSSPLGPYGSARAHKN